MRFSNVSSALTQPSLRSTKFWSTNRCSSLSFQSELNIGQLDCWFAGLLYVLSFMMLLKSVWLRAFADFHLCMPSGGGTMEEKMHQLRHRLVMIDIRDQP